MTWFIRKDLTEKYDFDNLQSRLDAARHLQEAGDYTARDSVLNSLKEELQHNGK